jgi:pimeloyl-ACP methyl ester carboxylesterase
MPQPSVEADVRDVIVVLPGIMGSTLARDGRMIWAPTPGAIVDGIRTFGGSLRSLALPEGIGDQHPGDGVQPVAVMPDLHVLPGIWTAHIGYGRLLSTLRDRLGLVDSGGDRETAANLLAVPYDWRLSNRCNGRRLKTIVEPALERWRELGSVYEDAKLVFLCHSMGGLVARWYVEREGGADITRKVITLGTPHRGAVRSLEQLVNGVHRRIGPIGLDLTRFARTLPSMYQLLPEYACIEAGGALVKTTERTIPELEAELVADGMRFHDELDEAKATGYDLHPIVGFGQPTGTTARIDGTRIELLDTIEGEDDPGDSTVPRLSAAPKAMRPDDPSIVPFAEQHGALQSNSAVLDFLRGVLTAKRIVRRAGAQIELGVAIDDVALAGEPVPLVARPLGGERVALRVDAIDERGTKAVTIELRPVASFRGTLPGLRPGLYRVVVGGAGATAALVSQVTRPLLVWEPELTP